MGKAGIILADLGMPEEYQPDFYLDFMDHVFDYSLPVFLHKIVMADRGIALVDPENPLARESFVPRRLVDMHGKTTNRRGQQYTECKVEWRPPGMKKNPWDHGYFLYKGDGKGGAPDVCQKSAAKIAGWYFGRLIPEKRVAWSYHCRQVYDDAVAWLRKDFPDAEFRHARYISDSSVKQAVEELLAAGCETIIYQCFSNPVYSDFEDYALAMPRVHRLVNGRAKLIFADQPGNQPAMREAYVHLVRDQLKHIPAERSVLLVLSRHGNPFKDDTLNRRAEEYRQPLEKKMRETMDEWGGKWQLTWSDDEYADQYWDPRRKKFSTLDAFRKAVSEGFDFVLEVPTDFIAENTDLMIFHAMKKYTVFSDYDIHAPIPYPDWENPLVRSFREGKTTAIYTGCPVGPYRKYVAEAAAASVSEILGNK
jgi:protoheme ferro-lyase